MLMSTCRYCGKELSFLKQSYEALGEEFCSRDCANHWKGLVGEPSIEDSSGSSSISSDGGNTNESVSSPFVAEALIVIGWLELIAAVLLAIIAYGDSYSGLFSLGVVILGVVSWAVMVGFGTTIKLLHEIKIKN